MALNKKTKELNGILDDTNFINSHYTVPYSIKDNGRYKHIDELLLNDGKVIKATLGPIDMGIFPFDGASLFIVTAAEENRIDIIASKVYGAASLYWIICYANNIHDPLNLPISTPLYIPAISGLRQFPNPLS
jgi:hypothetical protein